MYQPPEKLTRGGDAEHRALWRANLGGEIGEGREIVARKRDGERELPAGQLYAVARILGETDLGDRLHGGLRECHFMGGGGHFKLFPAVA